MHGARAKLCAASVVLTLGAACSPGRPTRFGVWEPIAAHPDATAVRSYDAADYADGKMFVWGASYSRGFLYDANTDSWSEASATGRPRPLLGASALWANGRVLLWGDGDGASYDPASDTWSPIAKENAPAPRIQHAAAWTGTKMIVWGGANGPDPLLGIRTDGGLYDPATDTWSAMTVENAPSPRSRFTSVWTGAALIVFGGQDEAGKPLGDGGAYDPVANTWTPLPIQHIDVAAPRSMHTAVWTGSEMMIWAGLCGDVLCAGGSAYNPTNQQWRKVSPRDAASKRYGAAAVWTGREVLIWSGLASDDGYRWEPIADAWTKMAIDDGPGRRGQAFAFWLGDRMLLWGGADAPATGGFYKPL